MAEGLVNHFLGGTWEAYSAGTKPSGYVHPLAIEAMEMEFGTQYHCTINVVIIYLFYH
jgi:protein-tyrosine-phosphatase